MTKYLFIAECPSNCEQCYFNTTAERAECSKCSDGLGVTDRDKICSGMC